MRREEALAWELGVPGRDLLFNKYFVDEIYAKTVVAGFMQLRLLLAQFDRWVDRRPRQRHLGRHARHRLDHRRRSTRPSSTARSTLSSNATIELGSRLRRIQTGRIQSYIYGIMTGALVLAVVAYVVEILMTRARLLLGFLVATSLPALARADGPPRVELEGARPLVLSARGGTGKFMVVNTGRSDLDLVEVRVRTSDQMPVPEGFTVTAEGLPLKLAPNEKHEVVVPWRPEGSRSAQAALRPRRGAHERPPAPADRDGRRHAAPATSCRTIS